MFVKISPIKTLLIDIWSKEGNKIGWSKAGDQLLRKWNEKGRNWKDAIRDRKDERRAYDWNWTDKAVEWRELGIA